MATAVHGAVDSTIDGADAAPETGPGPLAERRITDVDTIKALSDPLRLRILEAMMARPDETFTVKRLASLLGVSQTKLYHHINLLAERDLIQPAGQRVVSGIIETSYRTGQREISLDRSLLAGSSPQLHDVLTTVFDGARDDIERGLRDGVIGMGDEADPATRLVVSKAVARLTPEQALQVRDRLMELIRGFEGPEPVDAHRPYGLVVGFYPMAELAGPEDDEG